MTDKEILVLAKEVLDLEDKYDKTRHGPLRDNIQKKKAVLKNELYQRLKPRDPKVDLFEAQ